MKFEQYYISNRDSKSNCVIRSLCKILDKEYDDVYNGLIKTATELNQSSFNDIPVFEKYMEDNNIYKIDSREVLIKNLKLDNESYIVFCYDKKDFYHMIPVVNNVIYDKNDDCLNLYVISIYKKK